MHYDKLLIVKPTRCTNFSNLFLKWTLRVSDSSSVHHCTHSTGICHTGLQTACEQDQDGTSLILLASCQQTCMTYTIAVCTANNSWWWTEELSKTRRVHLKNKFEKFVHLVGFIIRKLQYICIFISITQDLKYKIKILHTIWTSSCGNSDTFTIGIRVRFSEKQRSWSSENSLIVVLFLTATTIPWCWAICNIITVHNTEHTKWSCRGTWV